ncbi:MAG: hypothetical protein ACOWWR_18070 [Eubacteriales bacterium]
MEKPVLDYDRDWEIIKNTQLEFIDEKERDAFLEILVRVAVYN